jgi:hypothetical protein
MTGSSWRDWRTQQLGKLVSLNTSIDKRDWEVVEIASCFQQSKDEGGEGG